MHLAMAALLLQQVERTNPGLLDVVRTHLKRIAPTINYAVSQDNNHGTSEAAALYIGGSWLARHGRREGHTWQQLGIKWLENRINRLIGVQGSFSQHSLNYHRVLLDTLSMVEVWRRTLGLKKFSRHFYQRALAASEWLYFLVNPVNGDGPNLGANDGARLLPLTDTDYRDYRPSVQLAMALFANLRAYSEETASLPLAWLGIPLPNRFAPPPASKQFDDGGYVVLRQGDAMALFRYPRFRFRPSHADALHIDLWVRTENLLRDAGTYSYNTAPEWLRYFPGTVSHNTIQFDDRDQMPRLGRFLFGAWLKASDVEALSNENGGLSVGAAYTDWQGVRHKRRLWLSSAMLKVEDDVDGFRDKAVLRWRLAPGNWSVEGNVVTNGKHQLSVHSDVDIVRFELTEGWESRYYLHKQRIPVLEAEIRQPGKLITKYCWQA
jgi:hypothetical protein